jgi:hypothetical protein
VVDARGVVESNARRDPERTGSLVFGPCEQHSRLLRHFDSMAEQRFASLESKIERVCRFPASPFDSVARGAEPMITVCVFGNAPPPVRKVTKDLRALWAPRALMSPLEGEMT